MDLKNLKQFSLHKNTVHLFCSCEDNLIHSISALLYKYLHGKVKLNKKDKLLVRRELHPIRYCVRAIANSKLSCRTKRQLLIDPKIYPKIQACIKKFLLPAVEKKKKKKNGT